jgi:DNA-binding LytR/AlgR family response regulator
MTNGVDTVRASRESVQTLIADEAPHGAINYLTKRDTSRSARAITKAYGPNAAPFPGAQKPIVANTTGGKRGLPPARLVAENSRKLYFLRVEEVDYIESCGNYVVIHVGGQRYVRRDRLKRLAAELSDAEFEWIRRTILLNLARVAFAEKLGRGVLAFTLTSGARLVSSRKLKLNSVCAEDYGG